MFRFFFIFCLFFITPIQAKALEINDEGKNKLKQILQDNLDYQKTVNEAFGAVKILYEGEINISQEEGYYAAKLPYIKLTTPDALKTEENSFTLDIGVITINAIPDENSDNWKLSIAIPPKMSMFETANSEILDVIIGEQNIVGIIDARLGYFTKLNADLKNINVMLDGKDIGTSFGGLRLHQNFEENPEKEGYYSGPLNVIISDLHIAPEDSSEKISLGEFTLKTSMNGMKPPTLSSYKEKLLSHAEKFNALLDEETAEDVSGGDVLDMILDLYDFEMNGFTAGYTLTDFNMINPNGVENKIGNASIGMGVDGLNNETGSFYIQSSGRDFPIDLGDEGLEALMPNISQIMIRAEDLPFQVLSDLGISSIKSVVNDPESSDMIGLGLMMRLPGILSQSGSKIIIENNYIGNDIYTLSLNGNILADITSMMGFSANAKLLFEGLDSLHSIVEGKVTSQDSENIMTYAPILSTLQKLTKLGQKRDSKDAYEYVITTTPEGGVLVNGKDAYTALFPTPEQETVE